MAGSRKSIQRLLDRHKLQISRELDPSQSGILSQLSKKGVINSDEEKQILCEQNIAARGDLFVEILSKKGFNAFREMCTALELESPHLLTSLLLDSTGKICILSSYHQRTFSKTQYLVIIYRTHANRPRSVYSIFTFLLVVYSRRRSI